MAEIYDTYRSTRHLRRAYPRKEFPNLVLIYVGYRGPKGNLPHTPHSGLDFALWLARLFKPKDRPTIIIFGWITMRESKDDLHVRWLARTKKVHFISAPLDQIAIKNAWLTDHGQPPIPDHLPWLRDATKVNRRARASRAVSRTKNP